MTRAFRCPVWPRGGAALPVAPRRSGVAVL